MLDDTEKTIQHAGLNYFDLLGTVRVSAWHVIARTTIDAIHGGSVLPPNDLTP